MEQLGWFASGGGWFCVFAVTVLSYADPDGSALLASASERAQARKKLAAIRGVWLTRYVHFTV